MVGERTYKKNVTVLRTERPINGLDVILTVQVRVLFIVKMRSQSAKGESAPQQTLNPQTIIQAMLMNIVSTGQKLIKINIQ